MDLETYIRMAFPHGLTYEEAVQLCRRLYCPVVGVPESLKSECSAERLAEIFATLAESGLLIIEGVATATSVENHHEIRDTQHWNKILVPA